MVSCKRPVVFSAASNTDKLNHTGCNTAKIIAHTAFAFDNRNAHFFADNLAQLKVNIFNFGHNPFVKIIFFAEFLPVICLLIGPKKIYISSKVSLHISKTVMSLAGFHFFIGRHNKRRISTKKSSRNKSFIKYLRKTHYRFDNNSAYAGFQRE